MLHDLVIKARPRTKLATPIPRTKCVVCARLFQKKKRNQITCSKLCHENLALARQRVNRLRERGLDNGELPTKACVICGNEFEQRQRNYICCGSSVCKKERAAQRYKLWSAVERYLTASVTVPDNGV